jgi:glycosyltransferase involved in cell wall biosynthesis
LSGKIVVIPNGVVVPGASPRKPRDASEPIRLLFVGRLAPNKGVPDLLEGMDELGRRGASGRFRLDIVGGGPLLDALRAANKRPNVAFLDKVSDDRLEELYASADALVLPTLFEGMPTVVLEAMARGIPVLVTDVGASKELVDDSNGQIIPKRAPEALADAPLNLDRIGPAGRAALGAAGRERASLRFTWQRVAQAHVDLFAQVAASMP